MAGPVDTSQVGFRTVSVRAEDNADNDAEAQVRYQVVWPWTGFFAPLNGDGTLNLVKAGSAVPVKFSLGGDRGLSALDGAPTSRAIACPADAAVDTLEEESRRRPPP